MMGARARRLQCCCGDFGLERVVDLLTGDEYLVWDADGTDVVDCRGLSGGVCVFGTAVGWDIRKGVRGRKGGGVLCGFVFGGTRW